MVLVAARVVYLVVVVFASPGGASAATAAAATATATTSAAPAAVVVEVVLLLLGLGLLEGAREDALLLLLEQSGALRLVVDLLSLELFELWCKGLLAEGRTDLEETEHVEHADVDVAEEVFLLIFLTLRSLLLSLFPAAHRNHRCLLALCLAHHLLDLAIVELLLDALLGLLVDELLAFLLDGLLGLAALAETLLQMHDVLNESLTRVKLLLARVGSVGESLLPGGEAVLLLLVAGNEGLLDAGEVLVVLDPSVLNLELVARAVVVLTQLVLPVVDLLQVCLLLFDRLVQLSQLLRQVVVLLLHLRLLLPHSVQLL